MLNIGIPDYDRTSIKEYLEHKEIKTLCVYKNYSFVEVDYSVSNQEKLMNTLKSIH